MEKQEVSEIVRNTVIELLQSRQKPHSVPVAVSNRHIHLAKKDLERLFGKGYQLNKLKDLSQSGQFAAKETVTLIGPKGKIQNVRILGPVRSISQVEVSMTDGFTLGLKPPLRHSGNIEGTPEITIQGPRGQTRLPKGLICAARHIHMQPDDAKAFGVSDKEIVSVFIDSERPLRLDETLVRVSEKYRLEMHVDFDEANAALITNGQLGKLERQDERT
jgi:putative phosphotransacetylase